MRRVESWLVLGLHVAGLTGGTLYPSRWTILISLLKDLSGCQVWTIHSWVHSITIPGAWLWQEESGSWSDFWALLLGQAVGVLSGLLMALCLLYLGTLGMVVVRCKLKSSSGPAGLFDHRLLIYSKFHFQILWGWCLLMPSADTGLNQDTESSCSLRFNIPWLRTLKVLGSECSTQIHLQ